MINEASHVSRSSADLELLRSSVNLSDINRHWQRRSQTFRGIQRVVRSVKRSI